MNNLEKQKRALNKMIVKGVRKVARKFFNSGYTSKQDLPIFKEVKQYVVEDKYDVIRELPYEKELFPYLLHASLTRPEGRFTLNVSDRLHYINLCKHIFLSEVRRLEFIYKYKIKTPRKGRKNQIVNLEKRKTPPSNRMSNRAIKKFVGDWLELMRYETMLSMQAEDLKVIDGKFLGALKYYDRVHSIRKVNRKGLKHRR